MIRIGGSSREGKKNYSLELIVICAGLGVAKDLLDEERISSDSLHWCEEEGRKIHSSNFLTKRLDR